MRAIVEHTYPDGKFNKTFYGTSSETKPEDSDIASGSTFVVVNTGDVYLFNESGSAGSKWVKVGG